MTYKPQADELIFYVWQKCTRTGSVVDQQGLDEHRSADEERSGGQWLNWTPSIDNLWLPVWVHPWDVRRITGYVTPPIARLTEPFLLCHIKPSSCRVCARVPLELQPEMKCKSQFARLFDGWRHRAAQINNQIHVPGEHKHRNYGDCSVAVGVNLCFFFPPPRLDRQRDRWFSLLRHSLFFFLFPPAARPPTAKITSRHLCFTEPSDLAADYLYFLSRCELASVIVSQVSAKRRRPICEQGMQVMSRAGPVSFYPAPKSHRCCRITRPQQDKRRRCFIFKEINVCSLCNSRIKES